MLRGIVFFVAAVLCAGDVSAQTTECQRRTVAVSVIGPDENAIMNVGPENLLGSIRHKPVQVISVNKKPSPPRVFLVIEIDGGMADRSYFWNYYVEVAEWLLASAPTESPIGLAVFGSNIESFIPPSQDRKAVVDALNRTQPHMEKGYSLYTATPFFFMLSDLDKKMGPRKQGDAVYILGDWQDISFKHLHEEVAKELQISGIRFFLFSIKEAPGYSNDLEFPYLSAMNDLAVRSGGSAVTLSLKPHGIMSLGNKTDKLSPEGKSIAEQFSQIFNYLLVDIDLPGKLEKSADFRLKSTGLYVLDPYVAYPQVLAPCAASTNVR